VNNESSFNSWQEEDFPVTQTGSLWDTPSILFNGYQDLFPGSKAAIAQSSYVSHSLPLSANVMNKCSYTSIPPPIYTHYVYRDFNLTFFPQGVLFFEQRIFLDKQINASACNGASIEYYSTGSTCFIMGNEALFS
jgi:hypothetical protein